MFRSLPPWAAPAAIALTALLAFGLTLKTGFMWDDHQMIEQNPRLAFSAANLEAAFKGDPFGQGLNYYRPLQTVSNMADFAVWGYRPFGFHLTNLLFHAATAVLFFYLAAALGFPEGAAFWAAVFLAAHPAAVEQMLVVAGRAELASSACILASLLLFLRGRAAPAFLLFLAAMGFKENGVITPALAALCLWRLGRGKKDYLKLLPFLAAVPVYLLLRHQALGMSALDKGAAPVFYGLFLKVPQTILIYLREALLPFDMNSHRMQPACAVLDYAALPALAAAFWLLWRKERRLALFCAAWYVLNLAPKMPLLATNDLMLDHWVYLANAGLFLYAADRAAALKKFFPAAALVLILASAFNVTLRDTDLKIYERAARTSSSKPMLYNLAREYYLRGRAPESRAILERITAADPGNVLYLNGLALARWKTGDAAGARKAVEKALSEKPEDAGSLFNLYVLLASAGRREEAAGALDRLLAAHPDDGPALLALARARVSEGRPAGAAVLYERLLKADPCNLEGLNDYGVLLAKAGDLPGAERMFKKALRLSPGLESARQNLAKLGARKK